MATIVVFVVKALETSCDVMVCYVRTQGNPLLDQDCQKFADNSTLILNCQHNLRSIKFNI